jgi:hypothetical protein
LVLRIKLDELLLILRRLETNNLPAKLQRNRAELLSMLNLSLIYFLFVALKATPFRLKFVKP